MPKMKRNKAVSAKEWEKGYGVIRHSAQTVRRVRGLARRFRKTGDRVPFWELMAAADRLASAAMWLTVHDSYARNVRLDGRELTAEDFKSNPDGHTGSSLNIVPGYVGYLLANAISGHTRGWIAEQGHAVSGIDCVNVLAGNVTPAHERYDVSDEGLTRFVRDFYSYRVAEDGRQQSPRGSHVNPNTAGGILEGGYLGFGGLQYVHLPLPGERLTAFLSDGAFEEQRGTDWASRWWRQRDCGLVSPIMIANGRRIDQRTSTAMQGGTKWFREHLTHHGFDPLEFDGRDPAAFAWAILEMERRLEKAPLDKTVRLPYGIAVTEKGYGFYGAGTNAAHNVPLGKKIDAKTVRLFNRHAKRLRVPAEDLHNARSLFRKHRRRPKEKDHPMVVRDVSVKKFPKLRFARKGTARSPMEGVDTIFSEICRTNPRLRPRVGNPDEMRSNRLDRTLDLLKHRVTSPERGVAESVTGGVITALNEEAVACAVLANKGGIGLIHTYEAFGAKMLGAVRQEIIFALHCRRVGRPQNWLSIPLVLTSHTYENGKNEQSHQDPVACEALMGEPAQISRVLFPPDFNSASVVMDRLYRTRGQIWTLVVPKQEVETVFDGASARRLFRQGAAHVVESKRPKIVLTAIGAYQLREVRKASKRLEERGIEHSAVCMLEPRRFADPKQEAEWEVALSPKERERFYPSSVRPRLFVTHTRAGRIQGLLQSLQTGPQTLALGYRNVGGTYSTEGLMFANHQSWAHILRACAGLIGIRESRLLDRWESAALDGQASPHGIVIPE